MKQPAQFTNMIPPPFISASVLGAFERCPWSWAQNQFHPRAGGDKQAAKWGSDFHSLIEDIGELGGQDLYNRIEDTFGDEAPEVYDYIKDIEERDKRIGFRRLGREIKFEVFVPELCLTLVGHIDDLLESLDGTTLVIRDYKTSLKFLPAVVWSNQIQPRLYNFAVRSPQFQAQHDIKAYDKYMFEICYPRQNKTVPWELEEENESLLAYVGAAWEDMKTWYERGFQEGESTKYFPQHINEYCGYCAVRDICRTYKQAIELQVVPNQPGEDVVQAYVRLKHLEKLIKNELYRLSVEIKGRFTKGEKEYEENGHIFTTFTGTRRSYSAGGVLHALETQKNVPLEKFNFDKLFSVVNTEADKLMKAHPELRGIFDSFKSTKATAPALTYAGTKERREAVTSIDSVRSNELDGLELTEGVVVE